MTAIRIGKGAGKRLGPRVEIIGGVILILIGVKILLEHLLA
jgi:putative Mn2+ efflux pump MntP